MYRIAAVEKKENGVITKVIVDFQTTLGADADKARMSFVLRNAEVLMGKDVDLVVTGPFC